LHQKHRSCNPDWYRQPETPKQCMRAKLRQNKSKKAWTKFQKEQRSTGELQRLTVKKIKSRMNLCISFLQSITREASDEVAENNISWLGDWEVGGSEYLPQE